MKTLYSICVFCLLASSPTFAQNSIMTHDGNELIVSNYSNPHQYAPKNPERKGFFLGIGLGPGIISYKGGVENYNIELERQTKVAFMSDLK